MSRPLPIQKLQKRYREEGLASTARSVWGFGLKQLTGFASDVPGHYRFRRRLLLRKYTPIDIDPVWIDPTDIQSLSGSADRRERGHLDYSPHFKPREANWSSVDFRDEVPYNSRRGGDWDINVDPFESLLMYQGITEWFIDERPWAETVYHDALVSFFHEQGWDNPMATKLATDRCQSLEQLFNSINETGYQSQRSLNGHPLHEVTINIGRDGNVLYNSEGRHRLCIAKVLGIDRIPALVLVVHEECDELPAIIEQ